MKQPNSRPTNKGMMRALNRRGTRADKSPPVVRKGTVKDPSICDRCGAIYTAKTWRTGRRLTPELLAAAAYTTCPACEQVKGGDEYYGRVLIRGTFARDNLEKIGSRIANIEKRATKTQPERKIVSQEWDGKALEVLTTSQKLAHRIGRELEKAFGGRARFVWDDEGTLTTTWQGEARASR
ncbi:MAG TPA: hypothetical protein VMT64_08945 [Candidatus Binataceae bacterium]|nr:hypothetical protein [Candidatus Binataceae bacterium]